MRRSPMAARSHSLSEVVGSGLYVFITFWMPSTTNICAAPYNMWLNTGGADGIEPPEELRAAYALYDQIKGASPDDLPALAEEFFAQSSENLWFIGVVGNLPHVGIVKHNFRNVPDAAISDWLQLTPGNTAPE